MEDEELIYDLADLFKIFADSTRIRILFCLSEKESCVGDIAAALEMSQNSMRYSWTFEEVDAKLKNIMTGIFHNSYDAAEKYGMKGNLVAGANIAGFVKVATAMIAQGIAY